MDTRVRCTACAKLYCLYIYIQTSIHRSCPQTEPEALMEEGSGTTYRVTKDVDPARMSKADLVNTLDGTKSLICLYRFYLYLPPPFFLPIRVLCRVSTLCIVRKVRTCPASSHANRRCIGRRMQT